MISRVPLSTFSFGNGEDPKEAAAGVAELGLLRGSTSQNGSAADAQKVERALRLLRMKASKGEMVHVERIPGQKAIYGTCHYLPSKLTKALRAENIPELYSHQAEALNAIFGGSSICACTPTASGKSLTYTVPVLEALLKSARSRALFIFPLKALAQDQLKSLIRLKDKVLPRAHIACYDGDTPQAEREKIRKHAQIVITNPDMLHIGILPNHQRWKTFMSNLRFIVVDEAHTYRGVFGSHVGAILRRLLRVARHHGAEPMFVCCSATIGNPEEHVKRLTATDVQLVEGSGAPTGEKNVVLWQPPERERKDPADGDPGRVSPIQEAAKILVELMKAGLQVLCFVEARKLTEIIATNLKKLLHDERLAHLQSRVDSYRAGYTPAERRKLEQDLQDGRLQVIVSTTALELGIDVGALDATVHVGLPSSIASLWQQMGRAGRRQSPSLAVVIAQQRPVDQFYLHNPKKLFRTPVERAFCAPANRSILRLHLPCAADELPLSGEDAALFQDHLGQGEFVAARDDLSQRGALLCVRAANGKDTYECRMPHNPAPAVNIRGLSHDPVTLMDEHGSTLEHIELKMAVRRVHRGAIYHHRDRTYEVMSFNVPQRRAVARLTDALHVTETMERLELQVLEVSAEKKISATSAYFGRLKVSEHVVGFVKKHLYTDKVLLEQPLDLLPMDLETEGLWWQMQPDVLRQLGEGRDPFAALTALKGACISMLPALTMSDKVDIGGYTAAGKVFLFDAYEGGLGIAKQAFDTLDTLWSEVRALIESCDCQDGCPCCIQSAIKETIASEQSAKADCLVLLDGLLSPSPLPAHSEETVPDSPPGVPNDYIR